MSEVDFKRIWGRIPVSTYDEIETLAAAGGMSVSQFSGQLVHLGLKQYYRMFQPEKAISPEFMAEIVKVLTGMGVEVSAVPGMPLVEHKNGKPKKSSTD